jgi:hypothetical protein
MRLYERAVVFTVGSVLAFWVLYVSFPAGKTCISALSLLLPSLRCMAHSMASPLPLHFMSSGVNSISVQSGIQQEADLLEDIYRMTCFCLTESLSNL